MTTNPESKRPLGRRGGISKTRKAILAVALAQFAERGYSGTSIRSIATAASVDPSLVTHYFKTKEELLRASILELTPGPPQFLTELEDRSPGVGTRVARAYLRAWEDPLTGPRLQANARAIAESPAAAAMASETLRSVTAAHINGDSGLAETQLAFSQLLGAAFARYILKVQPLTDLPLEQVADYLGENLERLLLEKI